MENLSVLTTSGLNYHYSKGVQTLFDIGLDVPKGSIYGFLGPNGSGKTTTLRLVLGLMDQQEGNIEIFGKRLEKERIAILKRVGSLIEVPSLYAHLDAKENLEIYREIYGATNERIKEVLQIVGLEDVGTKIVKKFSLGMKQRLSIALALLPKPELLILDEPSNGLDPAGIIELRQLIKKLNKAYGMTIVISSHLLGEIEKMVSHVGIIYKGKMLFQGTLPDLYAFRQQRAKLWINTSDNESAKRLLQDHLPERSGNLLAVPFKDLAHVAAINRVLTDNNIDVYLLHPKENDLEQLFIDLTSQP